jgi:hypothetical protein
MIYLLTEEFDQDPTDVWSDEIDEVREIVRELQEEEQDL